MGFSALFRLLRIVAVVICVSLALLATVLLVGCGQSTTTITGAIETLLYDLNNPRKIAVDSAGNVYIAATGNDVVLEVVVSTQTYGPVAGTGTLGYSGDGGLAALANLNGPQGVAVDSSGNLYIADTGNHVIRAVNRQATTQTILGVSIDSGFIATVAGTPQTPGYGGDGGQATSAKLTSPSDVAVDSSGNLYIADTGNYIVRKVASSGVITTVAGIPDVAGYSGDGGQATSAKLSSPQGVAVYSPGNLLYIADTGNDIVREVAISSGVITTVAGTPDVAGYSGNGGPATGAELNSPYGAAVDSAGNLFIADTGNDIIREVTTANGVITTVAGTPGVAGYSGDGGPATSAELNTPTSVAVDSAEDLYISDTGNGAIREVPF